MTDAQMILMAHRQMVRSDLQGGTISFLNAAYDCTIGLFAKRDVLVNGGVSPMLLGDVQAALQDFPADTDFKYGAKITVVPNTGRTRNCTIYASDFSGPLVILTLHDENEGA